MEKRVCVKNVTEWCVCIFNYYKKSTSSYAYERTKYKYAHLKNIIIYACIKYQKNIFYKNIRGIIF